MFLGSPWMDLGIMREHSLKFLNSFLPIHSIYLAGLVDFLVMLGCSLLLQDHLHMLLSLLLLSLYEVCKPYFPWCSHRRSDSRNFMNKYGEVRVSPWMVPLWIRVFGV